VGESQSGRITGAHRRCWFRGHFRFDRTSNPRAKRYLQQFRSQDVLPELVEPNGPDAVKRELILFV
jgi:hypothetical protein